jgi:2-oxoglutarate ferredoxin oxidoreductase subunit delta
MTAKGKIRVNAELCKGCGYCIATCPAQVIAAGKRFNHQGYFPAVAEHPEKCTGCAMCARVCPEIAITVFRRNGKR